MSHQQRGSFFDLSTSSIDSVDYFNYNANPKQDHFDGIQLPRRRRDDTNVIFNKLYDATLVRRTGERDVARIGGRKNKNEILGLTISRLIKDKHLNGINYSRDIELTRGIQTNGNNGEFVLVLRTDGRIVAMSDEVEHHLDKTMRSLYTQCTNMFECLDKTDGDKLRSILNCSVDTLDRDHRLMCSFRLPKGKRPSRTQEDIKTITMTGHFYSACQERLFVARCEVLVSRLVNGSSLSETPMVNNTMMKIVLNDDMTIAMVSSNVNDILGYSRNEMIGHWFGRFLTSDDSDKFEKIRQRYFQHEQLIPANICELFDFYSNHGDHRLTFLCQIRPIRERRSKLIKYNIITQMIDPSMRTEYLKYVHDDSVSNLTAIKIEPVAQVSPKTTDESSKADSPSLSMGLLMFDAENRSEYHSQQVTSPFNRSLSNLVAPFIFDDNYAQIFRNYCEQYSTKTIDDLSMKSPWADELASIDALMYDY